MRFLHGSSVPPADARAIYSAVDARWWTYGELTAEIDRVAAALMTPRKALVFCFAANDLASVLGYLASVDAGHAVALLDRSLAPAAKRELVERYEPDLVLGVAEDPTYSTADAASRYARVAEPADGLAVWRAVTPPVGEIHEELSLLLSTSGSTGSPKLVRLRGSSVAANAHSIASALGITASERAISSLPIFYSYGLSILNSHLAVGARVVLTPESVIAPSFWALVREQRCTSFAGVPYTYQMLHRLGLERFDCPSVRTMTQAGGRLSDDLILRTHEHLAARDARFAVMYGQTEATARIACLPSDALPEKVGSVGFAIPGGELWVEVDGERTTIPGCEGEVVYRGPNVMLGYAERRADLIRGDELGGILRTGDVGHFEADGALRLTGRRKRIAKLFGVRINLDEIEGRLKAFGPAAVVEGQDRLVVYCERADGPLLAQLRADLASSLRVHPRALDVRSVDTLPRTANGKLDYPTLQRQ